MSTDHDAGPPLDLSFSRSTRDLSAWALIAAVAAVAVCGIVFIVSGRGDDAVEAKIAAVEKRIVAQQAIADARTAALEERLARIDALPETMRNKMRLEVLGELKTRTRFLIGITDDEESATKLGQIAATIEAMEAEVSQRGTNAP